MWRSPRSWLFIFLALTFLIVIQGTESQRSYAEDRSPPYGMAAMLTVEKPQYAEKEVVKFSAFITNNNSFAVTVWEGCQATRVSTYSILNADNGRTVYEWKPTGLACNYLFPVRINASQSYRLGAIGLGNNLTWDQRSGTADSPDGFAEPGRYIIATTIDVVGFNPSETPCQPSGRDCEPSVDHLFSLYATETIAIGVNVSTTTPAVPGFPFESIVGGLGMALMLLAYRRRRE